jgi:hypothetical protein
MLSVGDTKNVVKFLKSQVLSLRKEEVAEDPTKNIPSTVPAEGTSIREGSS